MKKYFSLIKFSHTIFALPFALLGYVLGIQQSGFAFSPKLLLLVVGCMVFARSAAMAFNRYIDRDIDALNSRTAVREIPSGVIKPKSAAFFVAINCALFIACTYFINPICFFLSPIALALILGYSWTKRFTYLCHFVLGAGLALAPIGAYLAVTARFDLLPIIYSTIILVWVSGFDIIYALQDESFDASLSLRSIPVEFGRKKALMISSILHSVCAILIVWAGFILMNDHPQVFYLHLIGAAVFLGLLMYQHLIVSPTDLSRVNLAFFTTNGIASVLYGALTIIDFYF